MDPHALLFTKLAEGGRTAFDPKSEDDYYESICETPWIVRVAGTAIVQLSGAVAHLVRMGRDILFQFFRKQRNAAR